MQKGENWKKLKHFYFCLNNTEPIKSQESRAEMFILFNKLGSLRKMCNICAIVFLHTHSCGSNSSSGKCDQLPCTFVVTTDNLLERIEKLFV